MASTTYEVVCYLGFMQRSLCFLANLLHCIVTTREKITFCASQYSMKGPNSSRLIDLANLLHYIVTIRDKNYILRKLVFNEGNKNIKNDCHVPRHHRQHSTLIPSAMQIVNLFTKSYSTSQFHYFFLKILDYFYSSIMSSKSSPCLSHIIFQKMYF